MSFWGWVLVVVIIGFGIAIAQAVSISNKKKAMEEKLADLPDFSASQQIMSNNGDTGLAIDEERKKVVLLISGVEEVNLKPISYRDLLSSEIFEDGETVTRTARGSQIGGALIGGLAFGGVGAVIGGLSGKTRSSEKVKKIDLRIMINDTKNPYHDLNFMDVESKKNSMMYKSAMEQARHWHGLITVLIKIADNEDALQKSDESEKKGKVLLTDELTKLGVLRDKGILSDEEFIVQKNKLLSEL